MLTEKHHRARAAVVVGMSLIALMSRALATEIATPAEMVSQSLDLLHRGEETADPTEQRALYRRGLALAEQAVQLDPNNADAHYATFANRGRMMATENAVANLINTFRLNQSLKRALTLNPNHVGALIGRGSMRRELPRWLGGSLEEAKADFRHALALDPTSISARVGLARTYLKDERTQEAVTLLDEAKAMAIARKSRRHQRETESLLNQLQ